MRACVHARGAAVRNDRHPDHRAAIEVLTAPCSRAGFAGSRRATAGLRADWLCYYFINDDDPYRSPSCSLHYAPARGARLSSTQFSRHRRRHRDPFDRAHSPAQSKARRTPRRRSGCYAERHRPRAVLRPPSSGLARAPAPGKGRLNVAMSATLVGGSASSPPSSRSRSRSAAQSTC